MNRNNRRSMTLYLWSKKIKFLVEDLSDVVTDLKGIGEIIYKDGYYQGKYSEENAIINEKIEL